MGKLKGFLEYERKVPKRLPVVERLKNYEEFEGKLDDAALAEQGGRCMDCGIPFCHKGCPLGNIIPDWNHFTYLGKHDAAIDRLHSTNNFPEFTGRVCPAPCEEACVLNINSDPVTIKLIEKQIGDNAFALGLVKPEPAADQDGQAGGRRRLGPGGHGSGAAAGARGPRRHAVRARRPHRRPAPLRHPRLQDGEGADRPAHGADGGRGRHLQDRRQRGRRHHRRSSCRTQYDAVVLAGGATQARDLPIPGRELKGVHFAMEFLTQQNQRVAGDQVPGQILATGKTRGGAGRRRHGLRLPRYLAPPAGAKHVLQYELLPMPPEQVDKGVTWPNWPIKLRTSSSQEEGGERDYAMLTKSLSGDAQGNVKKLHGVRVKWQTDAEGRNKMVEMPGSEFEHDADLVLAGHGLHRSGEGLAHQATSASSWTSAATSRQTTSYETSVLGRVRLWRPAPRPVAGGVGNLGGTRSGTRCGCLPARPHGPARQPTCRLARAANPARGPARLAQIRPHRTSA